MTYGPEMHLIEYQPYLSPTSFDHLRQSFLAKGDQQYLTSAVFGAVFLESFLEELSNQLPVKLTPQSTLNDYISNLRGLMKNPQLSPEDKARTEGLPEVLARCEEVRTIRNRLVHDTGVEKQNSEADCESIINSLKVILDWYMSRFEPRQSNDRFDSATGEAANIPCVPVFISTITPTFIISNGKGRVLELLKYAV